MKIRKDTNQSIHDVERHDDARPYSIEASKKICTRSKVNEKKRKRGEVREVKASRTARNRKIVIRKNASSFSARVIRNRLEDGLSNWSLGPCLLVEVGHQTGSALRC